MFASTVHGLYARLHDSTASYILPAVVLLVARAVVHAVENRQRLLADGISMMIYDEICTMLVAHTWPLAVSVVITVLLSHIPLQLDPALPQIVQYSAWQTAAMLNASIAEFAVGRQAARTTTFVLLQLSMALEENGLTSVLRDVTTLAFFNVLLEDTLQLLDSLLPGDRFFSFCMSLVVFTACKQWVRCKKNET
jgi:hypothetical protein